MLIGQYKSKLTEKDRISVPKKIRENLGEKLVIARWYENCLVLVSKDGWLELMRRLTGESNLITSPVRDIDRFILASGFEVELDNQGRFVMPTILKEFSNITEDVVFLGLGDRAEVWALESWRGIEKDIQEKANIAIERISRKESK